MPANKTSRKQVQAERKARLEAIRKEQRRRERRKTAVVIGGAVAIGAVVIGAVGITLINRNHAQAKLANTSLAPAAPTGKAIAASPGTKDTSKTSAITGVTFWTGLSRQHVQTPVTYAQVPPVGGQHNPTWLNCGIYTQPVPNVNAVHDLEHGAVWITYQPTLQPAEVNTLRTLVHSYGLSSDTSTKPGYVDLSPYPGLPSKVVASAWGVQLKLDSVDDPRLKKFIDTYRRGPQTPEQGAACTGGIGSPAGTVTAGQTAPSNGGGSMAPIAPSTTAPAAGGTTAPVTPSAKPVSPSPSASK